MAEELQLTVARQQIEISELRNKVNALIAETGIVFFDGKSITRSNNVIASTLKVAFENRHYFCLSGNLNAIDGDVQLFTNLPPQEQRELMAKVRIMMGF